MKSSVMVMVVAKFHSLQKKYLLQEFLALAVHGLKEMLIIPISVIGFM